MSLRTIISEREDKALRNNIRNAFAMLTNADIQQVCSALANADPGSTAAMIVELIGPETDRIATILPELWGPNTLSDPEVAGAVVVGAAKMKGVEKPTKDDVRKAVGSIQLPPQEQKNMADTVERVAESAMTWGLAARLLADIALHVAGKKLIMLRAASRIPFLTKALATAGGAIFGAERALPLPPMSGD
jgi:hypothetical protein